VLVGALGVRFEHGARACAVDRRRHAGFAVETHVGVERRPRFRDRHAEHRLAVLLQRRDERGVARQRLERAREQQSAHFDADAGSPCRRRRDHLAQARFDRDRVFLGNHATVEPQHDPAGDDVGVGAAGDRADVEIGMRDARDLRCHASVQLVLRIERSEDLDRALQRVDAGRRDRRVRHLAVHRHLELQAAVVRGDDLVAEAGGDEQVGPDDALREQSPGPSSPPNSSS
jgi:hypothetical protein